MDKNCVTAVLRTRGSLDNHQTKVKRNGCGVLRVYSMIGCIIFVRVSFSFITSIRSSQVFAHHKYSFITSIHHKYSFITSIRSSELFITNFRQGCRAQLPGYPGTYPPGLLFLGKKPGFLPELYFFYICNFFQYQYIREVTTVSWCQKKVKCSNIHHFTKRTNDLYKILKTLIYYLLSLSQQKFWTKLTNL